MTFILVFQRGFIRAKGKIQRCAQVKIEGYVEFMACDDEQCLPPEQDSFR